MNGDPVVTPTPVVPAPNAGLTMLLAWTNVAMVVLVAVALGAGLATQIIISTPHTPDPTLMSAFTFVIGVIYGNYGQLFNSAFGSTQASKAKDDTISTLVVRGTGNGASDKPQNVTVVNKPSDPVPVESRP